MVANSVTSYVAEAGTEIEGDFIEHWALFVNNDSPWIVRAAAPPMEEATFDAHLGRRAAIDICHACQSFWFDTHESAALTPGSTLRLFRIIGEKIARPRAINADLAKCPRCKSRLRRTHDIQRTTKFEYLSCPHAPRPADDVLRLPPREGLHPAADASANRGVAPKRG